MTRTRIALLAAVVALTGCGSPAPAPTADPAAERDDEERIRAAGKAERKAAPTGKTKPKPARNPDDDD